MHLGYPCICSGYWNIVRNQFVNVLNFVWTNFANNNSHKLLLFFANRIHQTTWKLFDAILYGSSIDKAIHPPIFGFWVSPSQTLRFMAPSSPRFCLFYYLNTILRDYLKTSRIFENGYCICKLFDSWQLVVKPHFIANLLNCFCRELQYKKYPKGWPEDC
jgi:hypothetical protein